MGRFPFLVPIGKGSKGMDYVISSDDLSYLDERKFQTLFDHHPDAVIVVGINGKVIYSNPAVESMFGFSERHLTSNYEKYIKKEYKGKRKPYYDLAMNGQSQRFQAVDLNCVGERQYIDINYIPIMGNDLQVKGIYAIAKNITKYIVDEADRSSRTDGMVTNTSVQREYEASIEQLAYYCSLTGLPNRELFKRKLGSLIKRFSGTKQKFSVLHMDLDRFRNINDTLGHSIGDRILQQVGPRIQDLLHPSSFLAKIGGDEFGVILWDYPRSDAPEILAENILKRLREPFMIDDFELYLTASIGITSYPSGGTTFDELLKSSGIALYRAEANGKNNYQVYSATVNITTYKQFELERDLRKSIENEQLLVYFQPRVDAFSGKIVSAEALVRWKHPVWGIVSPGEFIPLAEETGFINEIGDWVLKQVCQYMAGWKERNLPLVPISINITAHRFLKNNWRKAFADPLQENHIHPSLIELEITETTLLQNDKAVEAAFQFLRAKGIRIALDDFGTGYSSLSHIKDFSIDTIKIDQSFVSQITKQADVEMIIKSLIFMAKGMDMNIVAEGVETVEQLTFLKQQECSEIQGYIFSKPVPEENFQLLLQKTILKPSYSTTKLKVDNRRKYYRIDLPQPLSAQMTITSIQEKEVSLGKTGVLIENIGPGGMRFLTAMHLPIRPDIVFQFETAIMEQHFELEGSIAWKNETKEGFQYGLTFIMSEEKRAKLIKVLHPLSLKSAVTFGI
ncbi:EAL domain-containing protein [Bacillus benzoevorans]|uniref:Diguanylate cyclase (GGDEF)-like protein/PAS domain S-box-containing protein n=1 Tax=Bacillus benzoevorans TaxID=1456 RepID=A0A7X0HU64_9BACI|nr:EAL domain-containing protein [Bacillus benzoevorans]MBB6446898.1 diguanylate cyclase (GGDEF)-like protein/PAS domain S-box-containing protein [Bacillus benzoevorans]